MVAGELGQRAAEVRESDEGGGESWGATGSQMKVGVRLGVLLEVSGSWRR